MASNIPQAHSFDNKPVTCIFRGEPEQAPNTRETGSGVYIYNIYIYIFIYLFVRDLAWQRLNAHAQTPHGRPTMTDKGRHQRRNRGSAV